MNLRQETKFKVLKFLEVNVTLCHSNSILVSSCAHIRFFILLLSFFSEWAKQHCWYTSPDVSLKFHLVSMFCYVSKVYSV